MAEFTSGAPTLPRQFGRHAFGGDPLRYHLARPGYPDWVYDILRERCGLRPGAAVFEIGAGTGTATRRLLDLGADPLIAIEPDRRLADFLRTNNTDNTLNVLEDTFEDVKLEEGVFDLGVSATAFHWLDEEKSLAKIARLLRPHGWWAAIWHVFGDDSRPDPFHEATKALLKGSTSPSLGEKGIPFALDAPARLAAMRHTGAFDEPDHQAIPWPLVLDAEQVVALYSTYSDVTALPHREAVLAELGRIARDDFGGRVVRNMTTSIYIARRKNSQAAN